MAAAKAALTAEAALKDARFLELRLDALSKPAAALPQLKDFLGRHRDVMAIATCRRKAFGGGFTGSLDEELDGVRALQVLYRSGR